MAETVELARLAVADGTGLVCTTPHVRELLRQGEFDSVPARVEEVRAELRRAGVPLEVPAQQPARQPAPVVAARTVLGVQVSAASVRLVGEVLALAGLHLVSAYVVRRRKRLQQDLRHTWRLRK